MMPLDVSKQWAKIVEFYEELSPQHKQEPMKVFVNVIAAPGVNCAVWPTHSHFTLRIFADNLLNCDANTTASVSAEYWHDVDKFRLHFFYIRGVPYDEKWCELGEAEATLRHTFRLLQEDRDAAPPHNAA